MLVMRGQPVPPEATPREREQNQNPGIIGTQSPRTRRKVPRRRESFDADPADFAAQLAERQCRMARAIVEARHALPLVRIQTSLLREGTELCLEACGAYTGLTHALRLTACALAALNGRKDVRAQTWTRPPSWCWCTVGAYCRPLLRQSRRRKRSRSRRITRTNTPIKRILFC